MAGGDRGAAHFVAVARYWTMIVTDASRILRTAAAVLFLAACAGAPPSSAASGGAAGAVAGSAQASPAAAAVAAASPASGPAGSQLGAADPVSAVRALFYDPSHGPTVCVPSTGLTYSQAAGCPVTKRLEARLQSHPTPGANPICRCQNSGDLSLSTTTNDGRSARVHVDDAFAIDHVMLDFLVVNTGGRWFVDDTTCGTDGAASSIYLTPVKNCEGP
jgi:hypothetical protein